MLVSLMSVGSRLMCDMGLCMCVVLKWFGVCMISGMW